VKKAPERQTQGKRTGRGKNVLFVRNGKRPRLLMQKRKKIFFLSRSFYAGNYCAGSHEINLAKNELLPLIGGARRDWLTFSILLGFSDL
jgi:hypothetical protein